MGRLKMWSAGWAVVASLGFAASTAVPASATVSTLIYGSGGICPATQVGSYQHSAVGGAGLGSATACNLVITFNADGSIVTTSGPQADYESVEDTLIGVVNNSGHAITSFNLSNTGVRIMGFDSDGIDIYTLFTDPNGGPTPVETNIGPAGSNTDTSGYGGYNAYFTNISAGLDSGTVNFANGGIPNGGTDFFSLEEQASLNLQVNSNVPEPATLSLLAAGLLTAGGFRFRRKAKKA
ncbi:MAG: PEP-CTERM sorting domain-containing protein [Alphaproteobacteria bacterium]|nr:PEP-CTERM sorting domain-containing protein [Alphaproteobacteria bacterium]